MMFPDLIFFISWGADGPSRGRYHVWNGIVTNTIKEQHELSNEVDPAFPHDEVFNTLKQWQYFYTETHEEWIEDARFAGLIEHVLAESS